MLWCILIYIKCKSFHFISAKQQVKQLGDDALSGTNSLSRKQIKAGSLANLIPSSKFEVSEMREVIQLCEYLCPVETCIRQAISQTIYIKGVEIIVDIIMW